MASRAQPPPKDVTSFVVAGAVVLGAGAMLVALPGALIIWVGLVIAGWLAPAPVLTGKEGRPARPAPAGPGEAKALRTYRIWTDLRWRLLVPTGDLLPGWPVLATWVCAVLAGVGVAALSVHPLLPPIVGMANAVAAYWVVAGVCASRRRFASDDDPSPGVRLNSLAGAATASTAGKVTAAGAGLAGLAVMAAVVVASPSALFGGVMGPWSKLVAAIVCGVLVCGAVLATVWAPAAMASWRDLVSARGQWKGRWVAAGLKDETPFLVSHQVVGQAIVDTFDAPASMGATSFFTGAMTTKLTTAVGVNVRLAVLETPNMDGQGQPVVGSTHPVRFDVVIIPADQWPDLNDPDLDPELARLTMRAAMTTTTDALGYARHVLVDMALVTAHPAPAQATSVPWWRRLAKARTAAVSKDAHDVEVDDDDLDDDDELDVFEEDRDQEYSARAVWATGWVSILAPNTLRNDLRGQIAEAAGVYVLVDHRARGGAGVVFFGEGTAPDTVFSPDHGITSEAMGNLELEDAWRGRWAAVLKQSVNAPRPEFALHTTERLGTSMAIRYQPFVTLEGDDPSQFFGLEEKLKATLSGAPFVAVTGFPAKGDRLGQRHSQAFAVTWSDSSVPSGPQGIAPQAGDAPLRVLAGRINEAFTAARLARPELARVVCLTSPRSRGHVWAMTLRLYGGVTLSDVRGAATRIRGSLASPWLRVESAQDGCVIYAGEMPSKVRLANENVDRQRLMALDWEQAWLDSKVSGVGGLLPKLVATDVLPKNDKVQVLDFDLPSGLAISDIKGATEKLKTATGNAFVEVRPGTGGPATVRLLVCEVNPLPDHAPYVFESIDESSGIPFATGIDGDDITYSPKVDPHLLVAGASGGGKSVTLQAVIYGALIRGWDVFVADPTKGAADFKFAAPYAKSITVDTFESAAMMKSVYAEVVRRKNLNSEHGVGNYRDLPEDVRPPHMLVVIDEFTSLMGQDPVPKESDDMEMDAERELIIAGNQAKTEIGVYTGKCAREARSAGLTLVLATQKLAAKLLDTIPGAGDLKVNLSRMLLGKATNGDRMSALRAPFEAPDLGDSVPPGRGLWETTEGAAKVMQSWYDPAEQARLAQELGQRLQPLAEADRLDLSSFKKQAATQASRSREVAQVAPREIDLGTMVLTLEDLEGFGDDDDDGGGDSGGGAEDVVVDDSEAGFQAWTQGGFAVDGAHDDEDEEGDDLDDEEVEVDHDEVRDDDEVETMTSAVETAATAPAGEPVSVDVTTADTVVFLDVTGVLTPTGLSTAWDDMAVTQVASGPVLTSMTALAQLGQIKAPIVWVSDMEASAQESFGPLIGRECEHLSPEDHHVDFGWWKIGAVAAWLDDHPLVRTVVWVDDELEAEDDLGVAHVETIQDLLDARGVHLVAVTPQSQMGMSPAHLAAITSAAGAGTAVRRPSVPAGHTAPVEHAEPAPTVAAPPTPSPASDAGWKPRPKTYSDDW